MNPEVAPPADLDEDLPTVRSMMVKNVSAREYVDVVGSVVYKWKAGETLTVGEHKDLKRDDFGTPILKRKSSARGPDGRKITKGVELVTAKGGTLDEIWKYLRKKVGNPLVKLRGDGKDLDRERWKMKEHSTWALGQARYQVDAWLKLCRDLVSEGRPVQDKPAYIFEAEQDIILFSRNTDEKRYKISLDGSRFNTLEECETFIRNTPWLAQYGETWRMHVQDMRGADYLAKENPNAVSVAPAGHSPAAQAILTMAKNAGKVLPAELVARLDTDPGATMEAMGIIMAESDEEEDPNAEPDPQPEITRQQGESVKDFKARKETGETREAFLARKAAEIEA